jgi:hypothetical protein
VAIHVTACDSAETRLGWAVDPQPHLELGRGPASEQPFQEIRGVAQLPEGGLAVIDLGTRKIRYFDARGQFVLHRGGEGSGPGEFKYPFLISTSGSDSLTVFDTGLRRFTSFTLDGTGDPHTLQATPWLRGAATPMGVVGQEILVRRITSGDLGFGLHEQDVTLLWVTAGSGTERVMRHDRTAWMFRLLDRESGMIYGRDAPFAAKPSATTTRTGALITSGGQFEIFEFDTSGQLLRILRIERRRQPVRPADYEHFVKLQIQSHRGSERSWRLFSDIPLPDSMPAFTAVQVDDVGWIWAKVSEWDTRKPAPWMVFDPEGRARGIVELPAGLAVAQIGADYVLGVWEDSSGVEVVRRHTLRRTDGVASIRTSM